MSGACQKNDAISLMGLHRKIGGIPVKSNEMIKDQKSVTHERKWKRGAVGLPEKPMSQNRRGLVVPATPQHLPVTPRITVIDQTPQSENLYYKILASFWQHYYRITQQETNNQ